MIFHRHKFRKIYFKDGDKSCSKDVCDCGLEQRLRWSKCFIESYPIYMVTAPFGVIFRQTEGSGATGPYGFSMSFNTELAERYIVKYMDGKQLKTATHDPDDVKVVVDGKFVYEVHLEKYYGDGSHACYVRDTIIHLPELPQITEPMTKKFIKLCS